MPNGQPTVVEIEGVGIVEFPADMSEAQVLAELQKARRDVQRGQGSWSEWVKDVGTGVVKGLAELPKNAGKAIHAIPGVSSMVDAAYGTPGLSDAAFAEADRVTTPANDTQGWAKMGEQIVESLIPSKAIARAGTAAAAKFGPAIASRVGATAGRVLPLVATEAAVGGGMAGLQGGDSTLGAVLSGAMPAVGVGARAARNAVMGGVQHTPEMARAVEFGSRQGVPIDAATATGRDSVANLQKRVGDSIGGGRTAERFRAAQGDRLRGVGEQLAAQVSPTPVTPEAAGRAMRDGVTGVVRSERAKQRAAYSRLDEIAQAAPLDVVAAPAAKAAAGLSEDQAFLLRWLADDLEEISYQAGGSTKASRDAAYEAAGAVDEAGKRGMVFNPRVAGTPIQSMLAAAGINGSRAEQAAKLRAVLQGRSKNPKALAVVDALAAGWDGQRFDPDLVPDDLLLAAGLRRRDIVNPASMPAMDVPGAARFFPEFGDAPVASAAATTQVPLAVDVAAAKQSLAPYLEELQTAAKYGPLGKSQAAAARALDALINGPDQVPAMEVERLLGALKGIVRGDDALTRTRGAGIASKAIDDLDLLVRMRLDAEDGAREALEAGRAATKAKHSAADVVRLLRKGDVRAYRQLTSEGDTNIDVLRQVAKLAPGEVPKLGRAHLDRLLSRVTRDGGFNFNRVQGMVAEWAKLGPETRKLLFPNPQHRADLDDFFRLTAKIAENPNPSGTAKVLTAASVPGNVASWALAKALYTPSVIRQLTKAAKSGDPSAFEAAIGRAAAVGAAR